MISDKYNQQNLPRIYQVMEKYNTHLRRVLLFNVK